MVDIESHKIIDIIESRDLDEVIKWLKTYKNLQVISRDGSITYKNAIATAHPLAIQVSDRFHLLKNLTDYYKDYLKSKFNTYIFIEEKELNPLQDNITDSDIINNKHLTLEKKWEKANELLLTGLEKSSICKQLNIDIRVYKKLAALTDNELKEYFKSTLEMRQECNISRKIELINEVIKLYKENYSLTKIAKLLGIDRRTVKKYIDPTFDPNCTQRAAKSSILDPYKKEIQALYSHGHTSNFIYDTIFKQGYTGSKSNLRHYCSQLKKTMNHSKDQNQYNEGQKVNRKDVMKLLYKPLESIKSLSEEILSKLYNKYPFFNEMMTILTQFKNMLKNKEVSQLEEWIEKAKALNNSYINSFVNGITRDIEAVRNSIIYDYNNGLAEGSVNKLKVIKRIMYGRSNFDLLKKKVLYLELNRKIN